MTVVGNRSGSVSGERSRRHQIPLLVLAAGALVVAATGAAAESVRFARDAGTVVASYREILGEVGETDAGPSVQVYGDGRALLHFPRYMSRAGDYSVQLSPSELDGLVSSLVDKGLVDFDATAVRSAQRQAAAAKLSVAPTVLVIADATTSVLEIRVERGAKRIVWNALREDARQYPNVSALQNLAAAAQQLRGLLDRADARAMR